VKAIAYMTHWSDELKNEHNLLANQSLHELLVIKIDFPRLSINIIYFKFDINELKIYIGSYVKICKIMFPKKD
jgi:hypothetical protein